MAPRAYVDRHVAGVPSQLPFPLTCPDRLYSRLPRSLWPSSVVLRWLLKLGEKSTKKSKQMALLCKKVQMFKMSVHKLRCLFEGFIRQINALCGRFAVDTEGLSVQRCQKLSTRNNKKYMIFVVLMPAGQISTFFGGCQKQ